MCGVLQKEERIILLWFPISPWNQFSPCSKTTFWDLFGHLSDKSRPFSQHCWVQFSALKYTSYFLAHTLLYSGRYFPPQSPHIVTFILDGFKPVWNVQLQKIWPELGRHESTSSELNQTEENAQKLEIWEITQFFLPHWMHLWEKKLHNDVSRQIMV